MKRKFFAFLIVILCFFTVLLSGCNDIFASDEEKALNRAHSDEFYSSLTKKEQADFDNKLKSIAGSDYFKNLDKKQKNDLVDKFVESEKTLKEVASDPVDKDPAEIELQISSLKTELSDVVAALAALKEQGANASEIAEAEQKQQEVEEQIKSAEQEKAYWETVSTTKETVDDNEVFNIRNSGLTIRRINSIFYNGRSLYVNADFVKEENIGGFIYKSKQNQYFRIVTNELISGNESYETILKLLSNNANIESMQICTNKNLQSHKDYFEKNKASMNNPVINYYLSQNYSFNILDSWEIDNQTQPNFMIEASSGNNFKYFYLTYNAQKNKYVVQELQKACPEFWNQLEIEQKAQAQEQKR